MADSTPWTRNRSSRVPLSFMVANSPSRADSVQESGSPVFKSARFLYSLNDLQAFGTRRPLTETFSPRELVDAVIALARWDKAQNPELPSDVCIACLETAIASDRLCPHSESLRPGPSASGTPHSQESSGSLRPRQGASQRLSSSIPRFAGYADRSSSLSKRPSDQCPTSLSATVTSTRTIPHTASSHAPPPSDHKQAIPLWRPSRSDPSHLPPVHAARRSGTTPVSSPTRDSTRTAVPPLAQPPASATPHGYVARYDQEDEDDDGYWYVVTCGTEVGVFKDMSKARAVTNGVSGQNWYQVRTRAEAVRRFQRAEAEGAVSLGHKSR